MQLNQYELTTSSNRELFEFYSEGPKGRIKKIIHFTKIGNTDIYNLGFGDENPDTGNIDDLVISNNKDSQKVLSTVAVAVRIFLEKRPEAKVFATGSTLSRTRLYQMGINSILNQIKSEFEIYGILEVSHEPFEQGKDYEGFLISRKNVKFDI